MGINKIYGKLKGNKKVSSLLMVIVGLVVITFSLAFFTDSKENILGLKIKSYTPSHVVFEYDLSKGDGYVNAGDEDLAKQGVKVYKGNYEQNKVDINKGFDNYDYELQGLTGRDSLKSKLGSASGIYTVVLTEFTGTGDSPNNVGLVGVPYFDILGLNTTDLSGMFKGTTAFNQDITNWDVSNVSNMSNMFEGASSFNVDLFDWGVKENVLHVGFNEGVTNLPDYKLPKVWQEEYKVVFEDRGNKVKTIHEGYHNRPLSITSKGDLSLPIEPTRTGYRFTGWESSQGLTYSKDMVMPKNDVIYEAQWMKLKIEVDTGDDIIDVEVDEDGNITLPEVEDKEGEEFVGWEDQDGNIIGGGEDVEFTEGDEYTPIWKPKEYTVRFEDRGGLVSEQIIKHGNSASAPSNPTRTGYTFDGWDKGFTNVTSDITVNANWKVALDYPEYERYLAQDSDFSGTTNGSFKYIGNQEIVYIPHKIKGVEVTSYREMFWNTSVKKVISDNPNVTDMGQMFYDSKATSLDLSSFDTSNVTNMFIMFTSSQATSLDLSSFDTSNVTNMRSMFESSQATSLDLSSFDTSQVTNMGYMFYGSRATSLDLSSFDTSNVTNMQSMFRFSKATSLDLSSFDTSQVPNMSSMFLNSQATSGYARTQADADRLNSSSNKPSGLTFYSDMATDADFSGTTNGSFKYIGNQEIVYIPHKIKGVNVTSYQNMFRDTNVKKVISDNPNVTDMSSMFRNSQATSLDLSSFNTSQVTNMRYMFYNSQATSLDLRTFDTSQVTNMGQMFQQSRATSLDLSSFDTSNVTNMQWMFYKSQATSLDLSSFDTSRVTNMSSMFQSSRATSLDLSSFDTSKVTDMRNMFLSSQATSLDLSSFDTSQVTNMEYMFYNSQATSGYARTQADANKFNSSSYRPSGLTFTVK